MMSDGTKSQPPSIIFSDQYDRYCRQIDKEDTLIDQRVNWLLVSQSILFAALGLTRQNISDLFLVVIPAVGIACSVFIGASIYGAALSLQHYRRDMLDKCRPSDDPNLLYPQLHRLRHNVGLGLVSALMVPAVFCAAWIAILFR